MKFCVHGLAKGKCFLHATCPSLYKQYLVLELVKLIIGPTSDIFILVLWPIELQLFLHLVGPSGGGGSF